MYIDHHQLVLHNLFRTVSVISENFHLTTYNLVIIGDFNINLNTSCSNSKSFHSLIESFDLNQKVSFPTHVHRHTLNLLLIKSNNDSISYAHTSDAFSSSFTLNLTTPRSQTNATVIFCKYHGIDKENMKTDLLASEFLTSPHMEAVD